MPRFRPRTFSGGSFEEFAAWPTKSPLFLAGSRAPWHPFLAEESKCELTSMRADTVQAHKEAAACAGAFLTAFQNIQSAPFTPSRKQCFRHSVTIHNATKSGAGDE
jgi:hypothetical protein